MASLDNLIDLNLLEIFGRSTIIPLVGMISDLSSSLQEQGKKLADLTVATSQEVDDMIAGLDDL